MGQHRESHAPAQEHLLQYTCAIYHILAQEPHRPTKNTTLSLHHHPVPPQVGFEAADRVLNTLQRTLPNTTPMDPPTNEIIEGAEMDTIDREADMEVEVSMHSMPGVAQMAGLLKRALNDAVQFAAGNPWVMQAVCFV